MTEATQLPAPTPPGHAGQHPAQLPAKPEGDFAVAGWPGGLFELTGNDFGSSKGTVKFAGEEQEVSNWTPTSIKGSLASNVQNGVVTVDAGGKTQTAPFTGGLSKEDAAKLPKPSPSEELTAAEKKEALDKAQEEKSKRVRASNPIVEPKPEPKK